MGKCDLKPHPGISTERRQVTSIDDALRDDYLVCHYVQLTLWVPFDLPIRINNHKHPQ